MSTGQLQTPPPPHHLQKPPGYRDSAAPIHLPPHRRRVTLPPSFRRSNWWRRLARAFCRCSGITMAALIVVSATAGGLFYLWFKPRLPLIHVKSITFRKFNISSTLDGVVLDSECRIGIEIMNPNRNLKLVYRKIRVFLSAEIGDFNLGEIAVPGFTQDRNQLTNLKLEVKRNREMVDSESAAMAEIGFRSKKLSVSAEFKSWVGVELKRGWATGTAPVTAVCPTMSLNRVQYTIPKCRIKILNRVYIN